MNTECLIDNIARTLNQGGSLLAHINDFRKLKERYGDDYPSYFQKDEEHIGMPPEKILIDPTGYVSEGVLIATFI